MSLNEDGASVIKTIIAFKNGAITGMMPPRKAAENAVMCFELFPSIRAKSTSKPLSKNVVDSGAFDVMMHYALARELKGFDDDIRGYLETLTLDEIGEINNAYTAISEMMIDNDEIPVKGGSDAVERIYKEITKDSLH